MPVTKQHIESLLPTSSIYRMISFFSLSFHSACAILDLLLFVIFLLYSQFFNVENKSKSSLTHSTIRQTRISDNNERKLFAIVKHKCMWRAQKIHVSICRGGRTENSFIPLSGFILIPSVERFNGFILMFSAFVRYEKHLSRHMTTSQQHRMTQLIEKLWWFHQSRFELKFAGSLKLSRIQKFLVVNILKNSTDHLQLHD